MEDKAPIAIFDFCGTFVNFQTADAFALYCLSEEQKARLNRKIAFYDKTKISFIFGIFGYSIKKHLIAKELKGLKRDEITKLAKDFTVGKLLPNINQKVLGLFNTSKEKGYQVVLVSAAYDVYLSEFNAFYRFDRIICSQLEVKNNHLTGRIVNDCIGKKKVKYLRKYLDEKYGGRDKYEIMVSVGDSKSDIPILDLARTPVVISDTRKKWFKRNYTIIHED